MNFSRAPKLPGFVSRVVPSKISARLGFSTQKEKEEDVGLEQVSGSDPQEDIPSTSRDFGYSPPVGESSTAIQRRGKKEKAEDDENRLGEVVITQQPGPSSSRNSVITVVPQSHPKIGRVKIAESESSSSSSASIEYIFQQAIKSTDSDDFEDNFETRSRKSDPEEAQQQEEPSQNPSAKQQQPQQQNLEEVIELSPEDDESGEINGFVPEIIQPSVESAAESNERNEDYVSINLDNVGVGESAPVRNPTYLERYLEYMYTCGLSPFLPDGASGGCWGYCQKICLIQVIIYWVFTTVAILEMLSFTKLHCLSYMANGGLEVFTIMCYNLIDACLKIYSAYLFTMQQKRFAKMLQSIGRLRAFVKRHSKLNDDNYDSRMVNLLIILSIGISTLNVVFSTGVIGWTLEKVELKYSYNAALAMFLWTSDGASENGTQLHDLHEEYGKNLTEKKAYVGILVLGIHWCNRLIANANSDLILTTAATLKKQIHGLGNEVKNPDNDIEPVTLENFEAPGGQWQHYELLKEANEDTNDTFDCLLKYAHVDNLMLFVYFIMNVFDGEFAFFTIVNFVYNIIKIAYTYRLGAKAAEMNDIFQRWIRRLMRKSKDKEFIQMAFVILDQMTKEPLGLGKGQFLIDENFLFRFLGGVGSVFVLQAQSRESN